MAARIYVKTLVANPVMLNTYNRSDTTTGFSTIRFDDYYAKIAGSKIRINIGGCYIDVPIDGKEYLVPDVFAAKATQVLAQLHKNKVEVQQLNAPVLTLTPYSEVIIRTLASNAIIMYKKNNDVYAKYTEPILIGAGDVVYAYVSGTNRKDSDIASLAYSKCAAPVITITDGVATITTATSGATIKYRLYVAATASWGTYETYNPESKPVLADGGVVSAYTTKSNKVDSVSTNAMYVVPVVYASDTADLTWVNNFDTADTEGAIYFNKSASLFSFTEDEDVSIKASVVLDSDAAETVMLTQKTNESGAHFWSYAIDAEATGVVQQLILMDNAATISTDGVISVDTAVEHAGGSTMMLYLGVAEARTITTFSITIGG